VKLFYSWLELCHAVLGRSDIGFEVVLSISSKLVVKDLRCFGVLFLTVSLGNARSFLADDFFEI
jgi:hypothetical protein